MQSLSYQAYIKYTLYIKIFHNCVIDTKQV